MKQDTAICSRIEPDYIPGTGIQVRLMNIRHLKAHHHEDALELLYCLKGDIWGHIAHDRLELHTGDLVTFDRDDVHNVFAEEDNLCLIVHIALEHPDYTHDDLFNTLFSCTTHPKYIRHPEKVDTVCDMLLAAMYASSYDEDVRTEICKKIHLNLVDIMMKHFTWFSIKDSPAEGIDKYGDRFHQFLGYLMNNYQDKITLAKLSETLYLNPSYISSFVRRTTFDSLTDAVKYFRCFYAEKYLLETNRSVSEISSLVGFSSEKYFYKAFRDWWGITPLQHRKRFQRYAQIKEEYYEYSPSEARTLIADFIADWLVSQATRIDV